MFLPMNLRQWLSPYQTRWASQDLNLRSRYEISWASTKSHCQTSNRFSLLLTQNVSAALAYQCPLLRVGTRVGTDGKFPCSEISNRYEPNESCQTSIRKRPVCPRYRGSSVAFTFQPSTVDC